MLTTTLHKIFAYIGGIALLALFALVLFNMVQMKNKQTELNQTIIDQKQLIDNITRAQSSFASKGDIDKFIQQNTDGLKAIQTDLQSIKGTIIAVDQISANSNGQTSTNIGSTSTTPITQNNGNTTSNTCDPYGYQKNQQNLDVAEKFDDGKGGIVSVPSATVSFSANQEKPWSIKVPERDYSVTSTIAETQPAASKALGQIVLYSQMKITVDGKEYTIPIKNSKLLQDPASTQEANKFRFWNPRLYVGASGGIAVNQFPVVNGSFTPTINFGFMTYGHQDNPILSILNVGAGINVVNKDFVAEIHPIDVNLGAVIPFIKSTYIGPTVGIDPAANGAIYVGAGLRVGL